MGRQLNLKWKRDGRAECQDSISNPNEKLNAEYPCLISPYLIRRPDLPLDPDLRGQKW